MIALPHVRRVHSMKITIHERGSRFRERLRERLDRAAQLCCAEHGQPVASVTIHARENGWFDSMWTTCCEDLEQKAAAIMQTRC